MSQWRGNFQKAGYSQEEAYFHELNTKLAESRRQKPAQAPDSSQPGKVLEFKRPAKQAAQVMRLKKAA
ncbi:MAG: hypothetical protein NDI61_10130 [Bdellovibrionaceae bacterium]|nr:hypothetical protein [Pseudobdellovibrionaceae bacterium]